MSDVIRNLNDDMKEIELFKIRNYQSKLQKEKSEIYTENITFDQVAFLNKNNFKLYYETFSNKNQFHFLIGHYFEKKKTQL